MDNGRRRQFDAYRGKRSHASQPIANENLKWKMENAFVIYHSSFTICHLSLLHSFARMAVRAFHAGHIAHIDRVDE